MGKQVDITGMIPVEMRLNDDLDIPRVHLSIVQSVEWLLLYRLLEVLSYEGGCVALAWYPRVHDDHPRSLKHPNDPGNSDRLPGSREIRDDRLLDL